MASSRRALPLILTALLAVGCGGTGGSSKPKTTSLSPVAVALRTAALRYDDVRNKVWATVPSDGSVVDIDPATGSLGSPIAVGSNPGPLAIADYNSTMYVGLSGSHSVRRVDLAARAAVSEFPVRQPESGEFHANDIEVMPGGSELVALTTSFESSEGEGPEIYASSVPFPSHLGQYEGQLLAWTSPFRLVAIDNTQHRAFDVAVDARGATTTRVVEHVTRGATNSLVRAGGRLYPSEGTILNESTLERVGAFPIPLPPSAYNGESYGPLVDVGRNRAYFVVLSDLAPRLCAFRLDTRALTSNVELVGIEGQGHLTRIGDVSVVRAGATGLAFRTTDHVYLLKDVSGL